MPTIQSIDAANLNFDDAMRIAELLIVPWPREGMTLEEVAKNLQQQWQGYDGPANQSPRYLVIWSEEGLGNESSSKVQAMCQVQPRTISTETGEITVLALARVCVAPDQRGQGIGAKITQAALEFVDHGDYPFALFQTTPPVQAFYEKLGACRADNVFINSKAETSGKNPFWDEVILRYPSTNGWPSGTIDILGPAY